MTPESGLRRVFCYARRKRLGTNTVARIPETFPLRYLRRNTAAVLSRVRSSAQALVITQRGKSAAVMLSVAAYQRGERERELLRLAVRGELEITAGAGHDLDVVLAEADAVIEDDHAPRPDLPLSSPIK